MSGKSLYIGTNKGLFVFDDLKSLRPKVEFQGQSIFSIGVDEDKVWVSPHSEWTGASLYSSTNSGADWELQNPIEFPKGSDASISKIWQMTRIGKKLLFGVEPAALFYQNGENEPIQLVEGLWNHPHRKRWEPGFGGLCLHTIICLSDLIWVVGISTGGVYRTEDGGKTWEANNQAIETPFLKTDANDIPEFGQCVHKIASHDSEPNELFLQHHWGVYRSSDSGKTWKNISRDKGLPSDFGFACVSNKPHTSFIIPLTSDEFRCFPDGKIRVYRTENSGDTWEELSRGLPQKDAYSSVLRDCFDSDGDLLVFGTTDGSVFVSEDNGENWQNIATHLPRITCVRIA